MATTTTKMKSRATARQTNALMACYHWCGLQGPLEPGEFWFTHRDVFPESQDYDGRRAIVELAQKGLLAAEWRMVEPFGLWHFRLTPEALAIIYTEIDRRYEAQKAVR